MIETILGKPASVDGVGLGAFSAGADIGFHHGGIGAVGRDGQCMEDGEEPILVATGGFAKGEIAVGERGERLDQRVALIGDGKGLAGQAVVQGALSWETSSPSVVWILAEGFVIIGSHASNCLRAYREAAHSSQQAMRSWGDKVPGLRRSRDLFPHGRLAAPSSGVATPEFVAPARA